MNSLGYLLKKKNLSDSFLKVNNCKIITRSIHHAQCNHVLLVQHNSIFIRNVGRQVEIWALSYRIKKHLQFRLGSEVNISHFKWYCCCKISSGTVTYMWSATWFFMNVNTLSSTNFIEVSWCEKLAEVTHTMKVWKNRHGIVFGLCTDVYHTTSSRKK